MNNILDHNTSPPPHEKPYFAFSASVLGIITIVLIIIAFVIMPARISIGAMFAIPEWLPKSIKISFVVGAIFTLLSFLYKEKTKAKWVGLALTILALAILLAISFYYRRLAAEFPN